jgi:hypothetical protein
VIAALATLLLSALQPSGPAEACTPQRAERTSVAAVARSPGRYIGRCVTVSGPTTGTTMFTGVEGLYLAHRGPGGHASGPPASLHRVGLYSRNGEIRSRFSRSPAVLTVTGTVDSCARMQARAEAESTSRPPLVMLGGFCHSVEGPVIHVVSYRANPSVRLERLAGERARRRFGTYRRPPPAWPHLPALRAFADEFLAGLRSGDRAALSALHADSPGEPIDTALVASLLDDRSVWAEIRRSPSPQTAIFVPTAPQSYAFAPPDPYPQGLICFCRTADCAQTWPIAWGDADNDPSRPYACTFVAPADWLARGARLNMTMRRQGLDEPARTAFRRLSESSRR